VQQKKILCARNAAQGILKKFHPVSAVHALSVQAILQEAHPPDLQAAAEGLHSAEPCVQPAIIRKQFKHHTTP
jgi:hypothetical protein